MLKHWLANQREMLISAVSASIAIALVMATAHSLFPRRTLNAFRHHSAILTNLQSLALNLGPHTTSPFAAIGVSIDNAPFFTSLSLQRLPSPPFVDLNVEGSANNHINLESMTLNSVTDYFQGLLETLFFCKILIYTALRSSYMTFNQGYLLPMGVDQAWTFLVGQRYEAEQRINAAPGAALTDIPSYGNVHGISYQDFKVEDTNYHSTDHNLTTSWDFARDQPGATHVVIHIGFVNIPSSMSRLRNLYKQESRRSTVVRSGLGWVNSQWGWLNVDGNVYYYYQGQHQEVLSVR
ncbi:hypothetical protein BJ912DRAFT_925215 [Pholiota molesta]|nr:hypothetical protein BJ912DRAFT_925215 [Pholiota molesta]